jgi:hypothetical protein
MVASAELIEKVAERYNFHWLITVNKKQSLYKIHILNALLYSAILIITSGSQAVLAEMYAVGLVASFTINTGSLLKYRYSKGTKEITYHTSRLGTLLLFFVLFSTLIYIMIARPYGTTLWFIITSLVIIVGLKIAKSRAPEIPIRKATNTAMDIIFKIMEIEEKDVHIYFRRPLEKDSLKSKNNSIYVSFYSPRLDSPVPSHPNHFWIAIVDRFTLLQMINGLLDTIQYEIPQEEKNIHLHFGWPLSSWWDRLSIGIMIHNVIRLPHKYPNFNFHMEYFKRNT